MKRIEKKEIGGGNEYYSPSIETIEIASEGVFAVSDPEEEWDAYHEGFEL